MSSAAGGAAVPAPSPSSPPEAQQIRIITKAELARGGYDAEWDDPQGIAKFLPGKREAFLKNPLSRRDDDPVQLVGLRGKRVVGRLDLLAGEVFVRGQDDPVPMFWTSELFVPQPERGTLMGVMLVLKMQQIGSLVGACAISQQALPVFERLKWLDFAMPRHLLIRRSRSVVERFVGAGVAGKAGSLLVDAGLIGYRAVLRAIAAARLSGLRLQRIDAMPPEMDLRLRQLDRPAGVHRSAAWINWLLTHHFAHDERNRSGLFFIRGGGGKTLGYLLLKSRFHAQASHRGFRNVLLGSLQDWMIFEPDGITPAQMILLAVRELLSSAWNVDAVEICLPPDWTGPRLKRWGFVQVGHLHCMLRAAPKTTLAEPNYRMTDAWRIRPAEGDNFFI